MITRDNIELKWVMNLTMEGYGEMQFYDSTNKIHLTRLTPIKANGEYGEQRDIYTIDGIDKKFSNLDDLIECYNDKFFYEEDNPETEVVYMKCLRNRRLTKTE